MLNKYGYKDNNKITYIYCIVETLESIADEYKHFINCLLKKSFKRKINPSIIDIYRELTSLLEDAYDTYYKFDMEKAVSIFLKRKELIRKSYSVPKTLTGKRITHHSINIAQKINDLIKFRLETEL